MQERRDLRYHTDALEKGQRPRTAHATNVQGAGGVLAFQPLPPLEHSGSDLVPGGATPAGTGDFELESHELSRYLLALDEHPAIS